MNELERSHFPPITVDFVMARVDHGRWITDCPRQPLCPGAARVGLNIAFECGLCGLGPLIVVFPPDQVAIERELLKRPNVANRNWRPGETAAGLQAENAEYGVA